MGILAIPFKLISYVPLIVDRIFLVNVGPSSFGNPPDWNGLDTVLGATTTGLKDTTNKTSGLSLAVTQQVQTGSGGNNTGPNITANGFPALAWQSYGFAASGAAPLLIEIRNLDVKKKYDFEFYTSRAGAADTRITSFTLNGVKKSQQSTTSDSIGNTVATLFTEQTTTTGTMVLSVGCDAGSYGYLNIMKIIEKVSTSTPSATYTYTPQDTNIVNSSNYEVKTY